MKFLPLLFILLAAPAAAQDIERAKAIMREVAVQCPRAYANAHANHNTHPERLDFIILAAQALKRFDARFGMNGKRGNASDPSSDAIAYGAGRSVLVIDVIVGAGEHGTNPGAITWNDVTGFGPGVYVDPDAHAPVVACGTSTPKPNPGETPKPNPPTPVPPAPAPVDLTPVLGELAAVRALLREAQADRDLLRAQLTHLAERVEAAHVSVLAAVDLGRQMLANPPLYKGGLLGIPVTLRPERP
jgi:hypothetical protein